MAGAFRLRAAENAGKKREKSCKLTVEDALIDESLTQAGERWRTAKERHEILQTAAVELDGIDAPEQRFFCPQKKKDLSERKNHPSTSIEWRERCERLFDLAIELAFTHLRLRWDYRVWSLELIRAQTDRWKTGDVAWVRFTTIG
ncbi:uncharacterized protein BKA78DRAFT_294343 [Phyllosticta capitalensis]|uniref:Uncharacterized protein n=1 Tax=Phyllosticta capitalensis TaxID=121624 RepID=A0ABR1YVR6_9PEZI